MALVTTKELLLDTQKNGYAVGAFNMENMEMVQAVVSAAEKTHSPVILQTTPSTVKYADCNYFYANVRTAAERAHVPVVMHLDHGNSFELAMQAMRAGYTSIMIDGSHYTFDENAELTKRVVSACHPNLIPVEAELGKVGGKEDDLDGGEGDPYTNPQEAARFVELTQVDSLAVAIGTAHGVYKGIQRHSEEIHPPTTQRNVQSIEGAKLTREIQTDLLETEPNADALITKILHRAELEYKFCSAGDADPATLQIQKACAEYEPTDGFPYTFYKEVISKVILYRDTYIEFKLQNGQIV